MTSTLDALQVTDWRRRVFALYARVREADDSRAGHALWQAGRDDLFARHPSSPLLPDQRSRFAGLPIAPYDPDWRFEAEVHRAETPVRMQVETGTDGTVSFDLLGAVDLPHVGSLDVWRLAGYGGGLFLPLKDALAAQPGGTYGGGRYLLDTIKGADLGPGTGTGTGTGDDTLILDLNFSYNPSCAYDPMWACPLPQAGNTVTVEVPVGERYHSQP